MFWPQNVSFFLSLSISFVWSSFRSDKHLTNYALRACVSACTSSYKVFVIFARFKPKQKVPTNISKNFPKIKFDENRFSGFQFVSFIQTDGQAEGATRIYYQPSSLTGHPSLTKLKFGGNRSLSGITYQGLPVYETLIRDWCSLPKRCDIKEHGSKAQYKIKLNLSLYLIN